jgi:hypothetical protein
MKGLFANIIFPFNFKLLMVFGSSNTNFFKHVFQKKREDFRFPV